MKLCLRRRFQRWFRRVTNRGRDDARPLPFETANLVVRLPKSHKEASLSLVDLRLVNSPTHRAKLIQSGRERTHPDIVLFYQKFQAELIRRGIPLYAFEFYRDNKRQDYLKRSGNSNASAGGSPHQYGCAVDVVHVLKLWNLTQKQWEVIGAIGKEVARKANIAIRWGGDWNGNGVSVLNDPKERFWDPAHWELENWREWRAHHSVVGEKEYFEQLEALSGAHRYSKQARFPKPA